MTSPLPELYTSTTWRRHFSSVFCNKLLLIAG
jgi:hypothetical protein